MERWQKSRRLLRYIFFLLTAIAAVYALLLASYINSACTRQPLQEYGYAVSVDRPRQRTKAATSHHREDTIRLASRTEFEDEENTLQVQEHTTGEQLSFGYLLAMVYAEQLSSATQHYTRLVNVAVEWGMKSVEPFITDSRLYGTQCVYGNATTKPFYPFSRFFNMAQMNRELSECLSGTNVSIISSRTDFLYNSYRDIAVVNFVRRKPLPTAGHCANIPSNKPYSQELETSGRSMIDCTGVAIREGLKVAVERTMNEELDRNKMSGVKRFNVRSVICVNAAKEVSLKSLKELIQTSGNGNSQESVVFIHWQGGKTAASFTDGKNFSRCSISAIQRSNEVSSTALLFIDSLGLKKPFLSVHIRSEKIMQSDFYHHGYKDCCLRRLHSLIDKIMMRHDLKDVLLVRDYGTYGTDACFFGSYTKTYAYCRNVSDYMMKEIGEWGIQYATFDPVKFRTIDNSGFVSLVEADALLQGSVLLTAGCGHFQVLLREKFLLQASSDHLYSVCPSYRGPAEALHGLLQDDSCDSLIP